MTLLDNAQEKGLMVLQKPYVPRDLARRVREIGSRASESPSGLEAPEREVLWLRGHVPCAKVLSSVIWDPRIAV